MTNYDIIPLSKKTLGHLRVLHKHVHGATLPHTYYEQKYDTDYLGVAYIGYIALFNNQPAAYFGVIPISVFVRGEAVLAAQACDAMTHADHRKQGLFAELVNRTAELAKQHDIHFIFGFPNQHSYPLLIHKLGFSYLETMERYTLSFKNTLYSKIARRMFPAKIKNEPRQISNIFLALKFDGIIYSPAYLKYKTYNSNFVVNGTNYSAWLGMQHGVWAGAMAPFKKEGVDAIILFAKTKLKSNTLTFMLSPGTELSLALSGLKAEEGFPVIVKNLSMRYSLDHLKFQFADIDIF